MTHKEKEIVDELREIAPTLADLGAHPNFEVPARYFDAFPEKLLARIKGMDSSKAVTEELEEVSPLLAGLSRQTPFSVPEGYFGDLTHQLVHKKENAAGGRVVKMARTIRIFKRCLVAAAVAGVIAAGAVFMSRSINNSSMDRMLAGISDQEIEEYLTYSTDAFDNESIFKNVSLEEELPSVLPEELSAKDIDNLLEENLLQEDPLN